MEDGGGYVEGGADRTRKEGKRKEKLHGVVRKGNEGKDEEEKMI